ncbi:ABC transporter substrate-binding protein [Pseudomonas sp. Choline-3u-10]|jgi:putative spermidine/putrescine transport system substrate-binding protein|uniref:ABC transporter substrate-binding protein n=1 Tax=Pseudomonadaceae TaxID=135621 RepID=UPI000535A8C0|nr:MULTISPECIES: ABC transporter substrate-binding protein [Pseudomonadaceae]MAL37902.1 ABC transporter substrate-binding protein [Pseudomonas sp.]MBU0949540.1 ABC transporter substrate-binding protein [Gammaproteobacteria bacterium]BAP78025.1 ABC transporter substrate-binding protein [Pseudomonas sp. MT-1]KJJ64700.1 ABC transporter substrate-binding protein [Pseudomonas sp. 10B238]MBK3793777.1 ABC transporter substrate-binding protein [Stutzerimonas stutzeri]|tara:strand:+ start:1163 stop:2221 length:1059 start_codon:yes stop_codon:yes gene_type:complete
MKRLLLASLLGSAIALATSANAAQTDLKALEEAARAEGEVNSVGMPDSWANWKDTWQDLEQKYGLKHMDTDMSSAQEIAKFAAEKDNATADIGDVGAAFGPIAVQQGVTQPYKPTTWDQIPEWAKDKDGHWMLAYTGSIAFIVNKQLVKDVPTSWAELKDGQYKVAIGDVSAAAQAVNGVLAAAIANGGDETNIQPGLDYFADIAKQGRLSLSNPTIQTLERGEVEVGVVWDFNGLSYRDQIDPSRFEVVIPSDGSVISGYTTIINKWAKHPNAAKLAREYILSDAGQINLAKGNARPIRAEHLTLPAEVQAKLLPNEQYVKVKPIENAEAWEATSKALPQQWQENVIIEME